MRRRLPYVLAPVPGLLVGAVIIERFDGGPARVASNASCALVGTALVLLVGRRGDGRTAPPIRTSVLGATVAVLVLYATLFGAGRDGVHRWVGEGGVQVNVSLLLTPFVLSAVARLLHGRRRIGAAVLLLAVQVAHVWQPDAAQASGVAVAACILLLSRADALGRWFAGAMSAVVVALALATWGRPDPLRGVAYVEDVFPSAFGTSTALGVAAVATALIALSPFALDVRRRPPADADGREAVAALGGYLAAVGVASQVGEFPVLVLGYGASTVLGYYSAALAAVLTGDREG